MEGAERDTTTEWLLPPDAVPPLLSELEARIDEAVVTARSSEQAARSSEMAVRSVGAAAVDAAKQARRAAELAERASEAALDASERAEAASTNSAGSAAGAEDPSLGEFTRRADRVLARLRALERPLTPARG